MSDHLATIGRVSTVPAGGLESALRRPPQRRPDAIWGAALTFVADVVALALAALISGVSAATALGPSWNAALLSATLAAFLVTGAYTVRLRTAFADEARRVLSVTAATMLPAAAFAVALSDRPGAGDAIVVHWLIAAGALLAGRATVIGARIAVRARVGRRRTLIVGAGHVGHLTAQRLLADRTLGMVPVGFLDKEPLLDSEDEHRNDLRVLGASWDLESVIAEHDVHHVVVAFSTAPHHVLLDIVRRCWRMGVDVMVVPRLYEVEGRRADVEHLGGLPLVSLRASDHRGLGMEVKYATDRVLATLALITCAPLLGAIALAVRVTMGTPVLFRQRRVGRDGVVFEMLKFRTMHGAPEQHGESDAAWAALVTNVPRVEHEPSRRAIEDRRTPLGALLRKLSLDELPQLWNVACGQMSLVGPRPERVDYVERFEDSVYRYADRHRVKSGLTGWAQIHGLRGETSLADRVEWDNFYIENWNLWLDIKIMVRTLPALIGRRGT